MRWVWIVVLWGCVMSPVVRFGAGKSHSQVVHEEATKLTPGSIRVVAGWSGPVQTVRARVWADDEYRAQHVRWQQDFQALIDDTNEILAQQFGIRLATEYREWSYREPAAQLDDKLRRLTNDDPGRDVMVVIGLTSSLALVTATFDQLGIASMPGRHMMIRGYSDVQERKQLEDLFRDLRKDERELMYDARRRHKTMAILLHELGHVFGADHRGDSSLMAPMYSPESVSFDEDSRSVILAGIDGRLGRVTIKPIGSKPDVVPTTPAKPITDETPQLPPLPPTPGDTSPVLEIRIDAEGRRIIDGEVIPEVQLDGKLLLGFDKNKNTRIVVRLYPNAPKQVAIEIVARAKKIGFKRVSIDE